MSRRTAVCKRPACPILVRNDRPLSPCPAGACAYQHAAGPSASERGYGGGWARISREYRLAHRMCEEDCGLPAEVVDHLDGAGPKGDNRWSNLEALCRAHHNARTLRYEGGWGNPKRPRPAGMKRCKRHPACVGAA